MKESRIHGSKNLVIVESPAKAKTLEKYLGRDFQVKASVGHVVDLPKSKLGVDVKKDFAPDFHVIQAQEKSHRRAEKGSERQGEDLSRLRPRPRRRSHRLAYRRAGRRRTTSASIACCSTRSPRKRCRKRSPIRRSWTATSSTRSRRAACSTGWSATRSARCCGTKCGAD